MSSITSTIALTHHTTQPTLHPTYIPTTRRPTLHPTEIPTHNPTKSPTTRPTKHPTSKPTNNPTNRPTALPTEKPTEQWDHAQNINVLSPPKPKKHNSRSSNPSSDAQLLKRAQRKARDHIARTHKQNIIKLYDYSFPPDATKQEMEQAAANYQDSLISDGDNRAVIVRDFTSSSHQPQSHVAALMTDLDTALEELHYLAATIVQVNGDSMKMDEKEFNQAFTLFLKLLRPLHNQPHLSGSVIYQLRDELDAFCDRTNPTGNCFNNLMHLMHSGDLLDYDVEIKTTFAMSSEVAQSAIRFLLIAYQELLRFKIEETKGFMTKTLYGNQSKIPVKFKSEFEVFEKSYSELLRLNVSKCVDQRIVDGFHTLMKFQSAFTLFSLDLQCASLIYEWRQASKQKHFGIIAISAGIVSQFNDIDALLNVLGYSTDSILRFRVFVTRKRRSFHFDVKGIEMSLLSKLTGAPPKQRKKHAATRKIAGNTSYTTHINNSSIRAKKNHGIVKLIQLPHDTTEKVSQIIATIVKDPYYDVVIVAHQDTLNASHGYYMYDVIDSMYDTISGKIIMFMDEMPKWGPNKSLFKTFTMHLFGSIIFDCTELNKSFLHEVLDLLRENTTHDLRKLRLVVDLLYGAYKQSGNFTTDTVGRYIKQDKIDGELIGDMLGFMELVLVRIAMKRVENVVRIMGYSKWSQDGEIPLTFKEKAAEIKMQMWDRRWCDCIIQYFVLAMDGSQDAQRMGVLNKIKIFRTNLMILRNEFTWLSAMCRVGNIIYNFQQAHDYGVIGIVGGDILHCFKSIFCDVLQSLGYQYDGDRLDLDSILPMQFIYNTK
eukprot:931792_1